MSGEHQAAEQILNSALTQADNDPSMSRDALANALLGQLLSEQSKTRNKADLMSFIEFQLDNLSEDEFVVTRGC